MEEKKKEKKEDNIGLIIWFLPMLTLPIFAIELAIPEIVATPILAVIGGTIGFLLYYLTSQKQRHIKLLTLGLLVTGLIGLAVFSFNRTESDRQELITCKVCGYIALKFEGAECKICMTEIGEEFRIISEYESIDELIKEEQLDFFTSDVYGEKRSLYEPKITESIIDRKNYTKDEMWKPVISARDLKGF